ncbi:hypothetical protein [Sulfobacillus harzensis]|uniref:Polymerase nucleotidyl transferase domain-containing protein n=1 Tax=Sulfobacillus harzensis TaxID=2729629 RepID=A0A7Y0L6X5_9FIRM|nr:hypothetical protein [Sulfobacillus harzensis]NMP23861.1 hypothetical protein [Sulfobacillus harzensis]
MDETARRVALAEEMTQNYRREFREHLAASACYGSVAHGLADAHSDLEMIILTDDAIDAVNVHMVYHGIPVECDIVPTARFFRAAQRVSVEWGIEADAYRHHLPIWDPGNQFEAIRAASLATPHEQFEEALKVSWWSAREWAAKIQAMAKVGNDPGCQFAAWQYLYLAALRIALAQQDPYRSLRSLWQEASTRGFGVEAMLEGLTRGDISRLPQLVEIVQQRTGSWGQPPDEEIPFICPK